MSFIIAISTNVAQSTRLNKNICMYVFIWFVGYTTPTFVCYSHLRKVSIPFQWSKSIITGYNKKLKLLFER